MPEVLPRRVLQPELEDTQALIMGAFSDIDGFDSASLFMRDTYRDGQSVANAVVSSLSQTEVNGFARTNVAGRQIDLGPDTRLASLYRDGKLPLSRSLMVGGHVVWGAPVHETATADKTGDAVFQAAFSSDSERPHNFDLQARFDKISASLARASMSVSQFAERRKSSVADILGTSEPVSPNAFVFAYDLRKSTSSVDNGEFSTLNAYMNDLTRAYLDRFAPYNARVALNNGSGENKNIIIPIPPEIRIGGVALKGFIDNMRQNILSSALDVKLQIEGMYKDEGIETGIYPGIAVGFVRADTDGDVGTVFWEANKAIKLAKKQSEARQKK